MRLPLLLALSVVALCGWPPSWSVRSAAAGESDLCAAAIRREEVATGIPRGLLRAVALTESGRRDPDGGGFAPWPWTVNNGGEGRYLASREEAAALVERLRGEGRRNIDVGCMQVNLLHHPGAFADMAEALDPRTNVAYGARFLAALQAETGSWERAVERYHTAEPARGGAYRERVYAHWDGAGATARPPPVVLAGASGGWTAACLLAPASAKLPRATADAAGATPAATPVAWNGNVRLPPKRTAGPPGRFFPIVFGPRPVVVASAAPATAASRPTTGRSGFALPKRGRVPTVLGSDRVVPGAVGPTTRASPARGAVAAAAPRPAADPVTAESGIARAASLPRSARLPPVTPVVEPAPGRIAFMAGGWLTPAAGPPLVAGARPARPRGVRPVRPIAAVAGPRPSPD